MYSLRTSLDFPGIASINLSILGTKYKCPFGVFLQLDAAMGNVCPALGLN